MVESKHSKRNVTTTRSSVQKNWNNPGHVRFQILTICKVFKTFGWKTNGLVQLNGAACKHVQCERTPTKVLARLQKQVGKWRAARILRFSF